MDEVKFAGCYRSGLRDFMEGFDQTDNPYEEINAEWAADWLKGWKDALSETDTHGEADEH